MLEWLWRKGNTLALLVGMYIDIVTMETVWSFLKSKNRTTTQPSNPSTGHITLGNHNSKDSCTTMFIAALFTITRTWKQPKCSSTDEWIKKMWHIYAMEYYSAMKRNEIELFVVRWMDLETVTQSEVSQKEENKHCMLTHIYGI